MPHSTLKSEIAFHTSFNCRCFMYKIKTDMLPAQMTQDSAILNKCIKRIVQAQSGIVYYGITALHCPGSAAKYEFMVHAT